MIVVVVGIVILFLIGGPLYLIMGGPSAFIANDVTGSSTLVPRLLFENVAKQELIALPMFILLGNLLAHSTAAHVLVEAFNRFLRHRRGGMVVVAIVSAMFFASAVGSAVAEAAILAMILVPPMSAVGYPKPFTVGLIAGASTLGAIIPPSTIMILYSALTGVSVGELFVAGIGPGLMLGVLIGGVALVIAIRNNYGGGIERATARERVDGLLHAFPVLLVPVMILGSIYRGIATPTESASVAVVYAAIIVVIFYGGLSWDRCKHILLDTAKVTSALMFLVVATQLMSFVLIYHRIPQTLAENILGLGLSVALFLLAVNVVLVILGIPLEPAPLLFITVPIVVPIVTELNIDPVHFGIIMAINLTLAIITPPVGLTLFTLASVADIEPRQLFRSVTPFCIVIVAGLMLVTFVPAIALTFG